MSNGSKPSNISDKKREILISKLVDELPVLRTKLALSQDELAGILGISRQTYSSIETRKRRMSWNIYLSLILIFDRSEQTHSIIHREGLFPNELFKGGGPERAERLISPFVRNNDDIREHLDDQALHAIETVIMVEYARCNNLTSEAVIKAFEGKRLSQVSEKDTKIKKALDNIKSGSGKK